MRKQALPKLSCCVFWLKETTTDSAVVKRREMSIWPQWLIRNTPTMLIIIHTDFTVREKFEPSSIQGQSRTNAGLNLWVEMLES